MCVLYLYIGDVCSVVSVQLKYYELQLRGHRFERNPSQ